MKDKLEAQKEVKAKAKEDQDVVAQQVWLFTNIYLCHEGDLFSTWKFVLLGAYFGLATSWPRIHPDQKFFLVLIAFLYGQKKRIICMQSDGYYKFDIQPDLCSWQEQPRWLLGFGYLGSNFKATLWAFL